MSLYVAAYDIVNRSRRDAVSRVLLRYGRRVQLSVFEIRLTPEDLLQLRRELGPLLAPTDFFDLYPVDMRLPERRLLAAGANSVGFGTTDLTQVQYSATSRQVDLDHPGPT